jgi:diguanylate cyclase (GGDEF)-like protein
MEEKTQGLFDEFQEKLDKMEACLEKGENDNTLLCFGELKNVYKKLSAELSREIHISGIERDLYSSPRALNDTLDHIVNIIKREFGFSRFDIVLMDHARKRVLKRYSKGGFGEEDFKKLIKHGALTQTRDYCLKNKTPWIVNDIKKEDPIWQAALELDVWSHGTFPLYYNNKSGGEELVGFLHGAWSGEDFRSGKYFRQRDVEELEQLGKAIAAAVREAKLAYFEHAIMRIQNAIGSTRMELSKMKVEELESGEDIQEQMYMVMDTIIKAMWCDCGGIIVKENQNLESICFRTRTGETFPPENVRVDLKPESGIVSRALYNGHSVVENEVLRNRKNLDLEIDGYLRPLHTLIAIPLIEPYTEEGKFHKNVIGVMVLLNKTNEKHRVVETDFPGNEGGFSSIDTKILESISPHIETIISNTRSHKILRQMSLTDGLTDLANHTHFMKNLLTLEFRRSHRYGTPLSMLLMDIDHFKIFNDIFGHQVGDLVLRETSRILRENTRSGDHIARYGGEEFAVLLHNTSLTDGIAYAEKIREKLAIERYVEKIREKKLLDINEAYKRLEAVLHLEDAQIRDAKISIMKKHFDLDPEKVVRLIEQQKLSEAEDEILRCFNVTLSIGLAFYPDPRINSKKDLVISADMLLLQAKEKGRNRVEVMTMI